MDKKRVVSHFVIAGLVAGVVCASTNAFAQFDDVLGRVRREADRVNANSPTYYLKSAKAVEPNVCLYSNGDPTGVVGPLVFRNSYVASPNCKEFPSCSEVKIPEDDPRPSDCGNDIPNSTYWSSEEKPLTMRSDGTASLEFISEEYVRVRACTEVKVAVLTCTTGGVRLFRSEVEYEYPSGYESRYNWDRFQNLAGRRTETKTRSTWGGEESRRTGNQKTTIVRFTGLSSPLPAHNIAATVSHKYGDQQATIHFNEPDEDLTHYTKLKSSSDGLQEWEITTEVNRRPSPPVTRVSFIPSSYAVSIEDKALPDLVGLPGGNTMQTKYLVTVYTENHHRDEMQIFQTEMENTARAVLLTLKMDQDALRAMKGKSKKIRVHVSAQRSGSLWIDGAVSPEFVYETQKEVKFPKK